MRRRRGWMPWILFGVGGAALFAMTAWRGASGWLDRRAAERALGVPLPAEAESLHFFKHTPSTDLAAYDAYVKFQASREAFRDLVRRRGLVLYADGGPNGYLPTGWKQAPECERLDWWDPSPETPGDAASGVVGANGAIVVKYERGWVYVIVSDTG